MKAIAILRFKKKAITLSLGFRKKAIAQSAKNQIKTRLFFAIVEHNLQSSQPDQYH